MRSKESGAKVSMPFLTSQQRESVVITQSQDDTESCVDQKNYTKKKMNREVMQYQYLKMVPK